MRSGPIVAALAASLASATAGTQVPIVVVGAPMPTMLHGRLTVGVRTAVQTLGAAAEAPGYSRPRSAMWPVVRSGRLYVEAEERFVRVDDDAVEAWVRHEDAALGRGLTALVTTPFFGLWIRSPIELPTELVVTGTARMPDHRAVRLRAGVRGAALWDRCVALARELALSADDGCAGVLRQLLATVRPSAQSDLVLPGGPVQFPVQPPGLVGALVLPPGWTMLVDDEPPSPDEGLVVSFVPLASSRLPPSELKFFSGAVGLFMGDRGAVQEIPGTLFGAPIRWYRSRFMGFLDPPATDTYFRGRLGASDGHPVSLSLRAADAATESAMRAIVATSRLAGQPGITVTPTWTPDTQEGLMVRVDDAPSRDAGVDAPPLRPDAAAPGPP